MDSNPIPISRTNKYVYNHYSDPMIYVVFYMAIIIMTLLNE